MSINGLGNSSAGWARFMALRQDAVTRNDGLAVSYANKPAVNTHLQNASQIPAPVIQKISQPTSPIAFSSVADVYSNSGKPVQAFTLTHNDSNVKPVPSKIFGGLFDAYA